MADSEKFPEDWLFKHRWGKGKKDSSKTLPSGEKIMFLTVGGRTSAVIPSIQKKTGPVAKEMSEAEGGDEEKPKAKPAKSKVKKEEAAEDTEKPVANSKKRKSRAEDEDEEQKPASKKAVNGTKKVAKVSVGPGTAEESGGRRRSARHSKT